MTLEVTTELKLNRITEEIAGWGNVDTAAIWATLAMQPEELNKGKLADINEKRDCNKKDEDIPEEVTLARNFLLKRTFEILHDLESSKNKMLEADPNLERIWQLAKA